MTLELYVIFTFVFQQYTCPDMPSSCALELLREVDLNLVNMRAHTFMKVTQDEPIKNGGGNLKVGYLQCLSSELSSENAIIVKWWIIQTQQLVTDPQGPRYVVITIQMDIVSTAISASLFMRGLLPTKVEWVRIIYKQRSREIRFWSLHIL